MVVKSLLSLFSVLKTLSFWKSIRPCGHMRILQSLAHSSSASCLVGSKGVGPKAQDKTGRHLGFIMRLTLSEFLTVTLSETFHCCQNLRDVFESHVES